MSSQCFLCNDDDAEPVAVGEDFNRRGSRDTFLAVCCRQCGLVYLNPWPAPTEQDRNRPGLDLRAGPRPSWEPGRAWTREVARFCQTLPSRGRLIDLGYGGDDRRLKLFERHLSARWQLEGADGHELPEGAYDVVLGVGVLEQEGNPVVILRAIGRLLRPGGKVLIATPNTDSTAFQVFKGRHWSEYDFPRRRNLFRAEVLVRSAAMAGLEVVSIRTIAAPATWVMSLRNLLGDWGANGWVRAVERTWGAGLAASAVIERIQQRRGKAGVLLATLERPSA